MPFAVESPVDLKSRPAFLMIVHMGNLVCKSLGQHLNCMNWVHLSCIRDESCIWRKTVKSYVRNCRCCIFQSEQCQFIIYNRKFVKWFHWFSLEKFFFFKIMIFSILKHWKFTHNYQSFISHPPPKILLADSHIENYPYNGKKMKSTDPRKTFIPVVCYNSFYFFVLFYKWILFCCNHALNGPLRPKKICVFPTTWIFKIG